jgi:2-polyprenyl-3-methyl-5-hydroxy-6-metoxy-1,4-benzoquinol methylase
LFTLHKGIIGAKPINDSASPAQHFEDPVAAYSRLVPHYAEISRRREAYLRSIEEIIASRVQKGSKSLVDIGAGDGSRALRIARQCGIHNVIMVEPSLEMAASAAGTATVWNVRAEDLNAHAADCFREQQSNASELARFDVITCLWNVLGHIRSFENRVRSLRAMRDLLAPEGKCFIDLNHRYNLRSYGVIPTLARFIRDAVFYKETNADVIAKWNIGGEFISTHGRVFTDGEIQQLARAAGLSVDDRIVVDYDNGQIRRFGFAGNLLYVFRRSSPIDSASVAHTS